MDKFKQEKEGILLKEYNDNYYNETYELFCLYKGRELVRHEEKFYHRLYFYSELKRNLKRKYLNFFLIYDIKKKETIGFIYCYNYDTENCNIFFDIFVNNQNYYTNVDIKKTILVYLNNIRINKNIRIIYSHCFLDEIEKSKFLSDCKFTSIGMMRGYRYYNKKYVDVEILELI